MHTPRSDRKQVALDPQKRLRRGRNAFVVLTMLLTLAGLLLIKRSLDSPFARVPAVRAARPFSAYRASIIHRYQVGELLSTGRQCGMIVEVHPGSEPILLAGDCAEPLTIEALLARFEPYTRGPVASRTCELADCTCALSVLTVERDVRTGYLRRIARDWRDATVGGWSVWRLLRPAPAPLRAALQTLAEHWNPCPPGTGSPTFTSSLIYSEEFQIVTLELL